MNQLLQSPSGKKKVEERLTLTLTSSKYKSTLKTCIVSFEPQSIIVIVIVCLLSVCAIYYRKYIYTTMK